MADGDANEQDVVPSGGLDGGRSRRLLWAGLGLLLVGVAVGVVVVLAFGGGDDSAPKVAVDDKALVPTSTRATPTTATTTARASTTTGGPSATSATAASGGGGTSGGGTSGGPTATSPPTTPTTAAPPPSTGLPSPSVVNVSVVPNFVVCPKFGGTTVIEVIWDTANADGIAVSFIGVDGQPQANGTGPGARGNSFFPIPCNGKQQQVIVTPLRNFMSNERIRGQDVAVFVNEGIEGT